jgi:methyltransferase
MIASVVVLGLVTAQRLSELVIARRNTRRLMARGAVEVGASHYPLIVILHAAWLAGLWLLAWNLPVRPIWLCAFLFLQGLRLWVLTTLGERWTTRIVILPGAPLVAKGPYRFVQHPNYLVVIGEIAVLPLTFGLVWYAVAFSLLNAAVLAIRIRGESRALSVAGDQPPK